MSPGSVGEDGAGTLDFTFTRTGDTTNPLSVDFGVGGDAVFSSDYTQTGADSFNASVGSVTIGAGQASATVSVDPIADALVELDEEAKLTIAASTNYNIDVSGSSTGTINDNDNATVTIGDASVTEGNSGRTTLSFPVTLSNPVDVDVTVDYETQDGSATTADGDYVGVTTPVTLTIPADGLVGQIDITVNGDTDVEPDETLEVVLSNLRAGGRAVSLGTILFEDDFDDEVSADPPGGWTLFNDDGLSLETSATSSVRMTSPAGGQTRIVSSGLPTFNPQAAGSVNLVLEVDSLSGSGGGGVFIDGAILAFISSGANLTNANVFKIFLQYDGDLYAGSRLGTVVGSNQNILLGTLPGYTGGPVDIIASLTSNGFRFTTDTGFDSGFQEFSTFFSNGFTYVDLGSTSYGVLYSFLDAVSDVGRIAVTRSSATGTITNDDLATISFDTSTSSTSEGIATHAVDVRLNLPSGSTLTAPVSVDVVDLLNGTAATPADYGYAPQAVTFNPGDGDGTIKSVSLSVVDDPNVEGDETVQFGLDNLVDGTGGQVTLVGTGATVTFTRQVDEDGFARDGDGDGNFETLFSTTSSELRTLKLQPSRSEERSLLETDISAIPTNATIVSATLRLTTRFTARGLGPADIDLLGYAGDGVLAASDATASTTVVGTVTIPEGDTSTHVIALDTSFVQSLLGATNFVGIATRTDQNESVSFHSTESGEPATSLPTLEIVYTTSGHTVTIQDNDTATVQFAVAASSVSEAVPSGSHDVTVTLDVPGGGTLDRAVSIDVRDLGSGTADSGDFNFNTSPKTVTFPIGSGSGSQSVSITILDDLHIEGDDTIEIDLHNLVDGTNGQVTIGTPDEHTVTITDDDVATISFALSSSSVGESAGTHAVDVQLDIPGGGSLLRAISVDVDLASPSGTAQSGVDYSFSLQTVTFFVVPFLPTQSITLDALPDSLLEGDETVNLRLTGLNVPAGALVSLAAPSDHEVTIVDDESATISFVQAASSVGEETDPTPHAVEVRIDTGGATLAIDVSVDVVDLLTGSAIDGGIDYTYSTPQTMTFFSGEGDGATKSVTLKTDDDNLIEGDETLDLRLRDLVAPSQVSLGPTTDHEVTIRDDERATVEFVLPASSVDEDSALGHPVDVVLRTGGAVLAIPVSFDVRDLLNGTAVSGADYSVPTLQTRTFVPQLGDGANKSDICADHRRQPARG